MSICIEGYHSQDFTEFASFIELRDYNNKAHILKFDSFSDNSPVVFISLTLNFILKNLTECIFIVETNQRSVQFNPSRYLLSQTNLLSLSLNGLKS